MTGFFLVSYELLVPDEDDDDEDELDEELFLGFSVTFFGSFLSAGLVGFFSLLDDDELPELLLLLSLLFLI